MPTTVPYTMPDINNNEATDVSGKIEKEVKVTLENPIVINKNTHDQDVFTYYTYENIQYPDKEAKRPDGSPAYQDGKLTFPQGVAEKDKQRWKPTIAQKDRASAMVLRGSYITHQGLTYEAEFKVFMGQNTIDDFTVKRNHKYVNNITIHGLDYVRNSDDLSLIHISSTQSRSMPRSRRVAMQRPTALASPHSMPLRVSTSWPPPTPVSHYCRATPL